ncbi:MAG: ABC transporter substrate-binding protein [Dehalococcoidia bacterium]|jgi:branched-chain amino acid transport system substrate-binding protein
MKGKSFGLVVVMVLALLVASVAGIAGCSSSEPEISEWHLPQLTAVTGPAAAYGLDMNWSANFIANQINDDGGVNGIPITVTLFDEGTDAPTSVTSMTEALELDPLMILGPSGGIGVAAASYLPAEEGIPFIAAFSNEEQRAEYAPWGLKSGSDLDDTTKISVSEWLSLNPDFESVVILYTPELFPTLGGAAEAECESLGIEVKEVIEVSPPGAIDLGPIATKALALEADGYINILFSADAANFCKAMYERGMTDGNRILSSFVALGATFFELGAGYTEGTYVWDCIDYTSTDPTWVAFVEAYGAAHDGNRPWTPATYGQCEGVLSFQAAIEATGVTGDPEKRAEERQAIRDYLWNATGIPSMTGGTFDYVEGLKVSPVYTYQIVDNDLVLVGVSSE